MNITYSFELTEDNKVGKLLAIPARAYEAQVDVEAEMYGEYRPATWDFPAEYPFLEVTKVSNLIVSFHEESQNLTFKMKLSPNSKMGTELDKLLEPHWDDIETHFWDIYITETKMKFKVGDKVRVTSVEGELLEGMDDFLNLVGFVKEVDAKDNTYFVDFGWKYFIDECDLSLEN